MITCFDIGQEYKALYEFMEEIDEETGEFKNSDEDTQSLLNELNEKKDTKLNNIEYLKREMKGQTDTLKAEIDRLNARKKGIEKTMERLKDLQGLLLNGEKLKTDSFTFSYRKSESVTVKDVNLLDAEYIKTVMSADKVLIKKLLKAGAVIDGAELVENSNLSIK